MAKEGYISPTVALIMATALEKWMLVFSKFDLETVKATGHIEEITSALEITNSAYVLFSKEVESIMQRGEFNGPADTTKH